MWLVTSFGFFSIVQKKDQTHLTVRARVAADLDELRRRYLPDLSETIAGQGTDYPFRATVSHAGFAAALSRMGEDIHYSNFKQLLYQEQGEERGHIFSEVWSVLHRLESHNQPAAPLRSASFARHITYGAVVINCQGQVLLREPFSHRGGRAWTFPKDEPRRGETPEETALRAARQKAGVYARVIDQIPGVFTGDTTNAVYYLMMYERQDGKDGISSKSVRWAARPEAETHIKTSTSVMSRARDLEVLTRAYGLYQQRFQGGVMTADQISALEERILTCAALRFDAYGYMDRAGLDGPALLEAYLDRDDLPASPLDQMCVFFLLQRRLMKWKAGTPKNTRAWQAFRALFLTTSRFCIPPEYRQPEYCERWRSEFTPKLDECVALVQVLHAGTVYPCNGEYPDNGYYPNG